MSDTDDKVEEWPDSTLNVNTVWRRDPATKVFSLIDCREKQVDKLWGAEDLAKALNCGISGSSEDGAASGGLAIFPPAFKYSPNTGKELDRKPSRVETWLPVHGSEGLTSANGLLRGGCLTGHSLQLKNLEKERERPPRYEEKEIKLPGPGYYRFCVASFGFSTGFLLALEPEQGEIHCWIPSKGEWVLLRCSSGQGPYLGTQAIAREHWSIEARDLTGDSPFFWPSEQGLAAVKIDILSLSYQARIVVEGKCVSVPRILNNHVYVLVEKDGGVHAFHADAEFESSGNSPLPINDAIPTAPWSMSATTSREIIWLSDKGQVLIRPSSNQYLFIPWRQGIEPQLQLGGPHCTLDGRLYMQVFDEALGDGEGGFGYVQLGPVGREQRPIESTGARALTGRGSIKMEQWLTEDPWTESASVMPKGEAVIPILESSIDKTLLVFRVEHLRGVGQFFDRSAETIETRFQLVGQHESHVFDIKRLRRPWCSTAFIFDETLFIYHPDIAKRIPGWELIGSV